jgi:hypothetical protein
LPDGKTIAARAIPKGGEREQSGFGLTIPDEDAARSWRAFLEEQQDASSLWSLIGRFASSSGEEKETARLALEQSPIGVLFKRVGARADKDVAAPSQNRVLRFHAVGENGEAYRIAFEKRGGVQPENSDLVSRPGFKALAIKAASRVMKQDVVIQRDAKSTPLPVRVVELQRGGFAYVHGGHDGIPVGLVGLAAGESILVEDNGSSVFPHFDHDDLERIACDTVKKEERPRARPEEIVDATPPPTVLTEEAPLEPAVGLDALRAAQARAIHGTRHYENKVIDVFPQVWIQATLANGQEVMGPTLRDGDRLLVLVLEGEGAPRIAKLGDANGVRVLQLRG